MDKDKNLHALDDEALDQVSGGVQFTTLIHKKGEGGVPNGLVFHGNSMQARGLVFRGELNGQADNLTGQKPGAGDDDNVLTSL